MGYSSGRKQGCLQQPPLFSDALNHSFPEESWQGPRLPQIQLCLFRCWLPAQEQSSSRPSSHKKRGEKRHNFYRYPNLPLKAHMLWMSGSSLSQLLLQNPAFVRHSNALSLCWCFRMDKHQEKHPQLHKGPDTHGL